MLKRTMTLDARLGLYAAAAAAMVPGVADAGVVGQTDLGLTITTPDSVFLDFGPGLGEAFRFELRSTNYYTYQAGYTGTTYYGGSTYRGPRGFGAIAFNALFQFNASQTRWTAASFVAGSQYNNDPARLGMCAPIGSGQSWYGAMSNSFSTLHDMAFNGSYVSVYNGFTTSSAFSYGEWLGGERGYIGFRLLDGVSVYYGWIDVEVNLDITALTIHGWALNTTPREGLEAGKIPAPGTAGLALLAMGAAGLRRQRRVG